MHSEAAWSILSPDPVVKYLPEFDEHIVYWRGVGMLHATALTIAGHHLCNIYPGHSVKIALFNRFLPLYHAGAFQTSDWDNVAASDANSHYDLLSSWLRSRGATKPKRNIADILKMLTLDQSV